MRPLTAWPVKTMYLKFILVFSTLLLLGCKQNAAPVAADGPAFDQYTENDAIKGGKNYADGGSGVLRYNDGCLYLEENGSKTGLVMPSNASFDGKVLTYRRERYKIGNRYAIGGVLVKSSAEQSFKCKTPYLILANSG
jgi:hypothetical protein